jgi:hypothetical protein
MTEPLLAAVESNGIRLSISAPSTKSLDGWNDFDAAISTPRMQARVNVPDFGNKSVADFFAELATDWRGWKDERQWKSIEGNMALTATIDLTGHIRCVITLGERHGRDDWSVTCVLMIESGEQLLTFSRDLTRMFAPPSRG